MFLFTFHFFCSVTVNPFSFYFQFLFSSSIHRIPFVFDCLSFFSQFQLCIELKPQIVCRNEQKRSMEMKLVLLPRLKDFSRNFPFCSFFLLSTSCTCIFLCNFLSIFPFNSSFYIELLVSFITFFSVFIFVFHKIEYSSDVFHLKHNTHGHLDDSFLMVNCISTHNNKTIQQTTVTRFCMERKMMNEIRID